MANGRAVLTVEPMTANPETSAIRSSRALGEVYVSEAMHKGVFTCSADTRLDAVASLMSHEHIHAVVVSGAAEVVHGDRQPWGIVSDLDLLRAALTGSTDLTAGQIAAMEFLTVSPAETLERAAQMMIEHEVTHLVVLDPEAGHAVGVLSTHDLAGAIGSVERPNP
jgi:CBS domain-containing protein